jgi:hypothetical protein
MHFPAYKLQIINAEKCLWMNIVGHIQTNTFYHIFHRCGIKNNTQELSNSI